MGAPIAAINLFQVDLDKPWNYFWYFYEKAFAPPFPLKTVQWSNAPVMPPLFDVPDFDSTLFWVWVDFLNKTNSSSSSHYHSCLVYVNKRNISVSFRMQRKITNYQQITIWFVFINQTSKESFGVLYAGWMRGIISLEISVNISWDFLAK